MQQNAMMADFNVSDRDQGKINPKIRVKSYGLLTEFLTLDKSFISIHLAVTNFDTA